jgi:hypothetical protein
MKEIIAIRPSKVTTPAPANLHAVEAQEAEVRSVINGTAHQFPERDDVITVYRPDRLCRADWPGEPTLEEWARSARASRCKWNASAHLLRAMTETATARQARARRARGNQCR